MALIPPERLFGWEPGVNVGVPGGITQYMPGGANQRTNLINVTEAPYNADNTGVSDAGPAIQDAVDAASAGDVVYIPTGTYLMETGVFIAPSKSGITVRGDGPGLTVLNMSGSSGGFYMGHSNAWVTPLTITGGITQGSTTLTFADTTDFVVDKTIKVFYENNYNTTQIQAGSVVTLHVSGFPYVRSQLVNIVSKTGTTLTIEPPIYADLESGLTSYAAQQVQRLTLVGMESFSLDASASTNQTNMYVESCFGCWFYNVESLYPSNRHIHIQRSLFCEVRKCDFVEQKDLGTPNHAGILSDDCGGLLIEDNIFRTIFPGLEMNFGTAGCVVAYNLFESEPVGGFIYFSLDTNHAPHNSFNLYEGNIAPNIVADGYYGSVSDDTVYRNWFHGTCFDDSATTYTHTFKRFTRNQNCVGNILGKTGVTMGQFSYGQPNIGNGSSTGTAEPTVGDFWADWPATATLTTRTSDTVGVITLDSGSFTNGQAGVIRWGAIDVNVTSFTAGTPTVSDVPITATGGDALPALSTVVNVYFSPSGYQELDLDVENSTIDKGNYLYSTDGAAGSMSSLGGDSLIDSYFRTTKPSWFGSLSWPPISPISPNSASYDDIPAGYRFLNNGDDPPAEGSGGTTITVANVTNFNIL